MPGLNQLKKFSEDMLNVGDEVKIRGQRGEKPVTVPVPQNITVDDDSDEFVLGLPVKDEVEDTPLTTNLDKNSVDVDFDDIGIEDLKSPSENASVGAGIPLLDDLFGDSAVSGADDLDLSDFEEDVTPPKEKEVSLDEMDLDALLSNAAGGDFEAIPDFDEEPAQQEPVEETPDFGDFSTLVDSPVPDEPATPIETPSVDEFSTDGLDTPVENFEMPDLGDIPVENFATPDLGDIPVENPETPDFGDIPVENFETPDLGNMPVENSETSDFGDIPVDNFDTSDLGDIPVENFETPDLGDIPVENFETPDFGDIPVENFEAPASSEMPSVDEFDMPAADEMPVTDEIPSADNIDFSADLDNLMAEGSNENGFFDAAPIDGLDAPDFGDTTGETTSLADEFSTDGLDAPAVDEFSTDGLDAPAVDEFSTDGLDAPAVDEFSTDGLDAPSDTGSTQVDASLEVPDFDADEFLNGMGISDGAEQPVTLDESELPKMDSSDFQMSSPEEMEGDADFVIPGFSDTSTAKADKKGHRILFNDSSDKPKNTFTEAEYETFKKNFATYPLNLRIAIEEFVAGDEFNDDVVFEILEKIYKKAAARQVASALEKWTGISVQVPRDYERRSVAEYEAYKQSFQYQLKNRIIPGAIVAVVLGFLGYSIFVFSNYFIYKPLKSSSLYKQGYALLQENEYPQSEIKFADATRYRPKEKWFFKYAEGYREHKQYDRASKIYKSAMFYFNKKTKTVKKAGLDWANMTLYDLANYQEAERIVRREILDRDKLNNDPDAVLLLGDIFLEWSEVDNSKFDAARAQYADLINKYGSTDLYLSRMMRYFIRLDGANSLSRVLELKARFFPNKKSLSGDDWIELSGYLLQKLYGTLRPNEEALRPRIEDLREMLERGTTFSPKNPVGHYNIARYYENTENYPAAKAEFDYCLKLFDEAPVRNKKNTYREINAHRHLGELYSREREFLLAQEIYTKGINLYQKEAKNNGLEGNSDIGVLYADLGDIDYFVAGDMDGALHNYTTSIKTFNDNAYLRYKVGNIHYTNRAYSEALGSFIKASETKPNDINLLLALGNTLSLRDDNFAALAYYDELIEKLDFERAKRDLLLPETQPKDAMLLDMYIKGCNNTGVTQYRIAKQTGNSQLNAKAIVNFSNSLRAYDALTRDKKSMVRVPGSNLAAQNSQYVTHPVSSFEPALYTDIPRTLVGEKGLY